MLLKLFSSSSSFCRHGRLFGALQFLRCSSSTTTTTKKNKPSGPPPTTHHFIVDYLISKSGFSSEKAIKASKGLSHLKSLDKPEFFVGFMRSHGFSDAHIKKIVSCCPRYLAFDAEKTFAPKIQALKDLNFSASDLIHLIFSNPHVLASNFNLIVLPKIQFWQGLLGSRDHLIRILKYNNNFLDRSIKECVMLNLSFLRSCGVSDERIVMVLKKTPRFILQRPQTLFAVADLAEKEMGIARSSGMFLWALWALSLVSKSRFNANLVLMKNFGRSEAEFLSAFGKAPAFLNVSQKTLARKMEFFVKEAGCKPSDVARLPVLLTLSLEKRLIPRHHVMKILKSRGLITRELEISSIMIPSEKRFFERYIIPHKDTIPELQRMYLDDSVWKEKEED